MKEYVALLPGDGIGPEVVSVAAEILASVAGRLGTEIEYQESPAGGAAIEETGVPLPPETFRIAWESKAVLLGAVGGPKWDDLEMNRRPEQALLALRKGLGLFANLRPVKSYRALIHSSPLKEKLVEGTDLLIVRELTGGIYFGSPRGLTVSEGVRKGFNTMTYSEIEIRRIAKVALEAAMGRRRKVTSVDKANILETSRFWREMVESEAASFPEVVLNHLYIDNCAMQLVLNPSQFDVVLSSNLFGDILSDEAAVLCGSIGLLPSASIGAGTSLYEPVHGSAPDIAGEDKANPIGTILSAAMMLRHTFGLEEGAQAVEDAVESVLELGYGTADIFRDGSTLVGTARMGRLILDEALNRLPESRR